MGFLKAIFVITITMALSIAALVTMKNITTTKEESAKPFLPSDSQPLMAHEKNTLLPSKRVSRFLAQKPAYPYPYPDASNYPVVHCQKDNEICASLSNSYYNSTCCNNKCMDVSYDKHNCGACKKKCKYTTTCCRGQCVDINFDKRHCGGCNNRCETGQYCTYGMCGYA
ncbi:stigma-specific STIG1-like protein 1 [Lotus japonicus]|uniref:stigma-specific STIG1-like protein 1 n=1 Tax=Lotus japonicus TaxID=34305 RepID=UPI00258E66D4|nr:stigma-specific STIG1-like protein 1 [Lotus japonicus]